VCLLHKTSAAIKSVSLLLRYFPRLIFVSKTNSKLVCFYGQISYNLV